MTFRTLHKWIAAIVLAAMAAWAAPVAAQVEDAFCGPGCEFDAQWFAPVDFDYNCLPIQKECGVFFNYNRLVWTITGERVTVGARGRTDIAEVIYYGQTVPLDDSGTLNPFAEGDPPPSYLITNDIQDAPPDADFGWGSRYEVGYRQDGRGWMVGVLDGPSVSTTAFYGFDGLDIPNSWPGTEDLPLYGSATGTPVGYEIGNTGFTPGFGGGTSVGIGGYTGGQGSAAIPTSHNGFGSVHMVFENGDDFLFGFRDYGSDLEGTIGGPGFYITAIGVVNGLVTTIDTATGGDQIIDTLDGDPINGFIYLVDDDDNIIGVVTDFGDLAQFNAVFDRMTVRNHTRTDGVEVMRFWDLDNSYLPVKEQRNHFQIGAGVRFFKMKDTFFWDARGGGWLGRSWQQTVADNQIVGPQIRVAWNRQQHKWNLGIDGRCMFGYNVTDMDQTYALWEDAAPGQANAPLYLQPHAGARGGQNNEFSPLVEMRAEARYQATRALALKVGYTAMFVDNITRASEMVVYRMPTLGLGAAGNQDVFINGVDFGFELLH